MKIRFNSPSFFGGNFYKKYEIIKDKDGKLVEAGQEYELTEKQLEPIDKRDYVIIDEDGEVVPHVTPKKAKPASKGAPASAENK